jgi:hypothetical protein
MHQGDSCAYDLGAQDKELFSTSLICHLKRPGAADGRRFGTAWQEGSLTGSITAKDRAALSLVKGPARLRLQARGR